MFFDSWSDPLKIIITGSLAYACLLILLRISGKRSLSKLNAFDWVVTVALGSTLSSIITSDSVSISEGVTALGLLLFLQYAVSWTSVRSAFIRRIVKSEPKLLYHNGEFLRKSMKDERITEDEILQSVRKQGIQSLEKVSSVVLETDGNLSIISSSDNLRSQTIKNVKSIE